VREAPSSPTPSALHYCWSPSFALPNSANPQEKVFTSGCGCCPFIFILHFMIIPCMFAWGLTHSSRVSLRRRIPFLPAPTTPGPLDLYHVLIYTTASTNRFCNLTPSLSPTGRNHSMKRTLHARACWFLGLPTSTAQIQVLFLSGVHSLLPCGS